MAKNKQRMWNCWVIDPRWKGKHFVEPIKAMGANQDEARINAFLWINRSRKVIPDFNADAIVCQPAEED